MARFGIAFAILLSTSEQVQSFHNFQPQSLVRERARQKATNVGVQRGVAASSPNPDDFAASVKGEVLGEALNSVTNEARDYIVNAVISDEPDVDEAEIALKQRLVKQRDKTYKVTLPLAKSRIGKAQVLSMGLTLRRINKGRSLDSLELNLDTLEYVRSSDAAAEKREGVQRMDEARLTKRVAGEFQGLVVASVTEGSAAWAAGVTAGDIVKTTSATIGSQLWPKSTLDGVRSAIMSRKAVSESIQFEFQRLGEAVDNQFELTLTRPIGLQLKETEDGYVEVTGFTENAPTLVQFAVKVGDLVLAVDSSLGDRMWPVSTVEGVVSAVTARLPGQQISFRFERPQANLDTYEATLEPVKVKVRKSAGAPAVAPTAPVVEQEELLKRCRDIIRRYATGEQTKDKFVNKYAVPGLVADKVLDALASAGAKVDRVTLSMIMGAYMSCRQPQKAIETFEAVVGINANGSNSEAIAVIEGKASTQILANAAALDVYTASALLKAHAMTGDLASVRRVLAALEGRGGADIDGLEVASWPGTGADSLLKPDTRCYNIAISAAADSKAFDGLDVALQIFNGMAEPTHKSGVALQKNLVSYNALINAMTARGRHEDAIDLFYKMKQAGVKPDKFSYTALVRAVVDEGDVEELLYDMREEGVTPDVITYNTVIKALCEQRQIIGAKKIVTLMERSGVAPDSITYGHLMTGLLRGGSPSAALTLFETACFDQRTAAVMENVYLFTTAISAAAALGDHDRALELVSRMTSMGIAPNLKTMTALVGACLAAGKPDLAFDVYKRISNPDGYAMTQGLQAMCQSRNVGEALTLVSGHDVKNRTLSGKQVMLAYKSMIESSLERFDYDMARRVLTDLFSKGHIPSKAVYQAIFESLKLFPKGLGGLPPVVHLTDEAVDKFKFLLFVIDSILARNLPCDAPLYSAILLYGSQLGSLPRKVAQIMVAAKRVGGVVDQGHKIIDETTEDETTSLVSSWEELFLRYDELKSELNSGSAVLPSTTVRVSSRDVPKVLKAEMGLSYAKRKPRSQEV